MSALPDPPTQALPPIPAKRYFTIGEVSELCGVKPHVLRYWEQEFSQLRPMKRRGNRRYYQHHEVLLVRRIRQLLYEEGFTINGARNRLGDGAAGLARQRHSAAAKPAAADSPVGGREPGHEDFEQAGFDAVAVGRDAIEDDLQIPEESLGLPPAFAPRAARGTSARGERLQHPVDPDAVLLERIREARAHLEAAIRILADG